ncbi:MAG TPA: lysozyme inhibitor LprI family protein [Chthoniobacterales bacterium]|nr:lysozyme inhibitor LprI family protein [Chthoniobacterales bacterium]
MKGAEGVFLAVMFATTAGSLTAGAAPSADASGPTGEKIEILATSPSGAFRIESKFPEGSAADASAEVWLVSTKDLAQRAKLPGGSAESPPDDEFHFSPNEEWLFGLQHIGSGLRYGHLYHILSPVRIEVVREDSFNALAWKDVVKLGALKKDYDAMGFYAMTAFMNWSVDSSRVLIRLCGGEEKRNMLCGFIYFNTRTNKFEVTDYSRKLNKSKPEPLACAEPTDPLPPEAELKQRLDTLDLELNKKYAEVLAKTDKDRVSILRQAQRNWLKQRDAGDKVYVDSFPPSEKARRHLQYLGGVTAARIDLPQDQWEW